MSRAVKNKDEKAHKCSCGRSFRHAISLKRHREVSGCEDAPEVEVEAEAEKPEMTKEVAEVAAYVPRVKPHPIPPRAISPTVVSAPPPRPALPPREPLIDLAQVGEFLLETGARLVAAQESAVVFARGLSQVLARVMLSLAIVGLSGWMLISGAAAEPSDGYYADKAHELSAVTAVEGFLQNAELNQYQRAHGYLTRHARSSVSVNQLASMMRGLPLTQSAERWDAELTDSDMVAVVTVQRAGAREVYTLHNDRGWKIASVALRS